MYGPKKRLGLKAVQEILVASQTQTKDRSAIFRPSAVRDFLAPRRQITIFSEQESEDFSLLVAFLLVTFSWFFRGFFVALFCLETQCLGLFRGFFVVFSVLGKFYAYSPWNSLLKEYGKAPE